MTNSIPQSKFAVRVVNLVKHYQNGTQANRGIDFIASRGEAIAILGPNGAGKTTFLRQLTTELKPSSGIIEIFGIDASERASSSQICDGNDAAGSGCLSHKCGS